tara:strand:+ start:165 stop:623 length:459 start_codon:yes stop_codon:yes gene_type:complete
MAKRDWLTGTWSGNAAGSYASLVIPGGKYSSFMESFTSLGKPKKKGWEDAIFYYDNKNEYEYDKGVDDILGRMKAKSSVLKGYWNVINGRMRVNMKSGKFKLWNDDGRLAAKGKLEDPKDRFPLVTGMSCSDKYPYLDSLDSWQQDILCGQL